MTCRLIKRSLKRLVSFSAIDRPNTFDTITKAKTFADLLSHDVVLPSSDKELPELTFGCLTFRGEWSEDVHRIEPFCCFGHDPEEFEEFNSASTTSSIPFRPIESANFSLLELNSVK
jgi:hypothetical protein